MMSKRLLLPCFVFSFFVLNTVLAQNPIKIGNEVNVNVSTQHPYSTSAPGVVFEKEFESNGAGYVKIHFTNFDLAKGDLLQITSPNTGELVNYVGEGRRVQDAAALGNNSFWSQSIFDDHVIVRLYSNGGSSNYGFEIDRVAYGYSKEELDVIQRSICGADDKEEIICYQGTEMYQKGRAVCRLVIGGSSLCTGWLLGSEGHIMTNNHCIGSANSAGNTEFQFDYEYNNCNGSGTKAIDVVATSSTLVKTNSGLDYTLVKLPNNPTSTYGFLSFRSTAPQVGERIYIPQHPGGRRKEIAVNDDQASSGLATITGNGNRVTYRCDTEGGSSGSPVLAFSSNLVVALHNTGGCNNGGNRNNNIIADLGSLMPNGGVDNNGGGGNSAPSISLTSPGNGQSYIEGDNVTLSASASDSDGSVALVEFFVNGSKLGEDTSSPYGLNWNNVSQGSYSITAIATDNEGLSTTSSAVNITVVDDGSNNPPPACSDCIDIGDYSLSSYSAGDFGTADVLHNGATLRLQNNAWKSINLNYTVTPNTVIEFLFSSTNEGEIHGIGFDIDAGASSDRIFKVHGTQSWGITDYDDYTGTSYKAYSIPVGAFYTGAFNRLAFACDDDANLEGVSTFSNIRIYENVVSVDVLNFNSYTLSSHSGADGGTSAISNNGATLSIQNNAWKSINLNYNVTSNTVLEFDFSSSSQGEIHGIGFDIDAGASSDRVFKLHGTQNWGITEYDNYASGTVTYQIPVGDFYTGSFDRLVFVCDDDANGGGVSVFSNVKVYETESLKLVRTRKDFTVANDGNRLIDDELGLLAEGLGLFPNPAINTLYIMNGKEVESYSIFNLLGTEVTKGTGNVVDVSGLSSGTYLLQADGDKPLRFQKH